MLPQTVPASPAFCFDAETALIRAEGCTKHEYLRIRRATRGLARATRAQLNAAWCYCERVVSVERVHGV